MKLTELLVHDISDVGVSFYAPLGYTPITFNCGVSV